VDLTPNQKWLIWVTLIALLTLIGVLTIIGLWHAYRRGRKRSADLERDRAARRAAGGSDDPWAIAGQRARPSGDEHDTDVDEDALPPDDRD